MQQVVNFFFIFFSSDVPDLPEESILQGWPEEETAASQMVGGLSRLSVRSSSETLLCSPCEFISVNFKVS